ncbi:DUF1801 domain-containing protein [Hydrogenophaga sp. 5NK40-0174]|uniref:iron chaperone n=1 Tax=Hydrogenophaga sp. 5NK40-0174 TaxID=3127649 RepID=UPI00310AB8C4
MAHESQEAYFETLPAEAKTRLQRLQASVLRLVPGATKCISYNMPAFRDKRVFFYFAAFKKHIGIYPPVTRDAALIQELAPFRGPKGNLSFPLDQPLPVELIERVILALHREYENQ